MVAGGSGSSDAAGIGHITIDLIKKTDGDSDFKLGRFLEEPDSHKFRCPNCNACIENINVVRRGEPGPIIPTYPGDPRGPIPTYPGDPRGPIPTYPGDPPEPITTYPGDPPEQITTYPGDPPEPIICASCSSFLVFIGILLSHPCLMVALASAYLRESCKHAVFTKYK